MMMQTIDYQITVMNYNDKDFSEKIGARIAEFRKKRNLTQSQLAEILEVKQEAISSYEIGRRRVPVGFLPVLSETLGVSVEELLGLEKAIQRPGPTPKLQQLMSEVGRLPKSRQRFVTEMLEHALHSA
jgi:transcriptional regulator with XRE-family HTH domain